MKNDEQNIPDSIIDLFINELETHSMVLETGLIELENNQHPDIVRPLMRAAHSIKGASRVVSIKESVELAHAMEDVLSLCQKGELHLSSIDIDLLLKANDIYLAAKSQAINSIHNWFEKGTEDIKQISERLRSVASGIYSKGDVKPPADLSQDKVSSINNTEGKIALDSRSGELSKKEQSFVRVNTEKMNRILGFAGENLVQSKSIGNLFESIHQIQFLLRESSSLLNRKTPSKSIQANNYYSKISKMIEEARTLLSKHTFDLEKLDMQLDSLSDKLYYEAVSTRMRPISEAAVQFPRMVRDVSASLSKKVKFVVNGSNTQVDKDILEKLDAPLNHLIRNAIDHGIEYPEVRLKKGKPETGTIILDARHRSGLLVISVSDDGKGIDHENIRKKIVERRLTNLQTASKMSDTELMEFLFLPGFTTTNSVTEISGRGVGLDIVHTMVQEVSGTIRAESHMGKGTTFILQLPVTLSLIRALIVDISNELYAIPLSKIDKVLSLAADSIETANGNMFFKDIDENIALYPATELLGIEATQETSDMLSLVIVRNRLHRFGIIVNKFTEEKNIVVLPLDPHLGNIPHISASAILDDGSVVLILELSDILDIQKRISNDTQQIKGDKIPPKIEDNRKRVLIVDDSPTIRETLKLALEKDYKISTAEDGQDAWELIEREKFDIVITDIDMPQMNGIELVRLIKQTERSKSIPVIVHTYNDSEEIQLEAEEAGADMFFTKASFNPDEMLALIKMLV